MISQSINITNCNFGLVLQLEISVWHVFIITIYELKLILIILSIVSRVLLMVNKKKKMATLWQSGTEDSSKKSSVNTLCELNQKFKRKNSWMQSTMWTLYTPSQTKNKTFLWNSHVPTLFFFACILLNGINWRFFQLQDE